MTIATLYEHYLQYPIISTDTRTIPDGCLFFALKGANFNGNKFASEALKSGAKYAIIDEAAYQTENTILVDDVLKALQDLANHHRKQQSIPFIGITGSNGKTTTKELMHAVLSSTYSTLATAGNFNNHIGVPLTLLRVNSDHEIAIIEMGANRLKEIGELCAIAEPDYGLITNIGKAHIEGFGSFEGIRITKRELFDHLKAKGGHIFVNGDNPLLHTELEGATTTTYGSSENNTVTGRVLKPTPFLNVEWTYKNATYTAQTMLVGSYNMENVLSAITVGLHFNISPEDINKALFLYTPSNNRSQIEKTARNMVILDAYNANPTSMAAAIDNFMEMEADHRYFILGDMLELGDESKAEHQAICDRLIANNLTQGILVGTHFSACSTPLTTASTTDEALELLQKENLKHHLVLIKGSRGIRLERCAPLL